MMEERNMERNGPGGRCPAAVILQKTLGGKWKIEILYYIVFEDVRRFGELRRHLGNIAESSLTKQLRELEALGLLIRRDFGEMPLRVEYELTDLGRSLMPVMEYMKKWAEDHAEELTAGADIHPM